MRNILIKAILPLLVIVLCGCVIVPYEKWEESSRSPEEEQTSAPAKTRWEK